jgi:hypothetical protein
MDQPSHPSISSPEWKEERSQSKESRKAAIVAAAMSCTSGWGAVGLNFAWLHPPGRSFRVDIVAM